MIGHLVNLGAASGWNPLNWSGEVWWVAFGFAAQAVFAARFIVQWLYSEKHGRSVIPLSFWHISTVGATMLLMYAIYRRDPVFIMGQGSGLFIYLRNLALVYKQRGYGEDIFAGMLAVLICGFLLFLGLGDRALWSSGEGRIAQIARTMRSSGDYVVPRFQDELDPAILNETLTKPPLYHWVTTVSQRVFGETELAARMPSAAAGLLCVVVVYLLARKAFSSTAAFMAVLVLGTSLGFWWASRIARLDAMLTLWVTLAMACFYFGYVNPNRRRWFATAAWAAVALGVITKGPGAVVFPVVTLAVFLLVRKDARPARSFMPWQAVLAFVLVAAPWHVMMVQRVPARNARYYFFGQAAGWFDVGRGGDGTDDAVEETPTVKDALKKLAEPFKYVGYLALNFFPWSFFLPAAAIAYWRHRHTRGDPGWTLIVIWLAAGLVVLSLVSSKSNRYMVPLYPPAAMLVAGLWHKLAEHRKGVLRSALVLLVFLAALASAVLVVAHLPEKSAAALADMLGRNRHDRAVLKFYFVDILVGASVGMYVVMVSMVALGAGCLALLKRHRARAAFACLAGVFVLPMAVFVVALMPRLDARESPVPLTRRINLVVPAEAPLALCGKAQPFWRYYLDRPVRVLALGHAKLLLDSEGPAYALLWPQEYEHLQKVLPEWMHTQTTVLLRREVDGQELVLVGNRRGTSVAFGRCMERVGDRLQELAVAVGQRADDVQDQLLRWGALKDTGNLPGLPDNRPDRVISELLDWSDRLGGIDWLQEPGRPSGEDPSTD